MLAFSSAACGAGRRIPRSMMRLSASPPQREITAKSSSIPGEAAAAEHAAKGIENIAASRFDGARGQIRVAGAANMLGQGPSGIVGHDLLPTAPMFRYYLLSPGHAERLSRSPRLKSALPLRILFGSLLAHLSEAV